MSIPVLHTADEVWFNRGPVPMSPDRARDNFHRLLRLLNEPPEEGWTPAQLARLKTYILDTFDVFPDLAPGWQREWREEHQGARLA